MLGLLYGEPDQAFFLREIIEILGVGSGQIQRELTRLSQAGILRRFKQGRHVYFQANPACPVYDELRSLITKSLGAAAAVRTALEPLAERDHFLESVVREDKIFVIGDENELGELLPQPVD